MFDNIRTGWFLAVRQIRRTSVWTTALIVFVMTLTFLNLIVIGGILVGLVEGSSQAFRSEYSGDVILTNQPNKAYIKNTPEIVSSILALPGVKNISVRYTAGGKVEANYKEKTNPEDVPNESGVVFVGIDPDDENSVTGLSRKVIEGEYLSKSDSNKIMIGSVLLEQYNSAIGAGQTLLENVKVGSKVRITIGGLQKEVTVKGIIKSKIQEVGGRIFMIDTDLRKILGRNDYSANEIVVKTIISDGLLPAQNLSDKMKKIGLGDLAHIDTWKEAQGKFFDDLNRTFNLLGNVIGGIGLAVASVTVFIVIFINAITRRKYIGILKGIGLTGGAIEFSYVCQSIFYAFMGSGFGLLILVFILKPYFDANPIDFPFSDGILSVTVMGVTIRILILFVATMIAGYIPAKIIVRQNTLDAILGR